MLLNATIEKDGGHGAKNAFAQPYFFFWCLAGIELRAEVLILLGSGGGSILVYFTNLLTLLMFSDDA